MSLFTEGMTDPDVSALIEKIAPIAVCERCQQEYGRLPIDAPFSGSSQFVGAGSERKMLFYVKDPHCIQCGGCGIYFPGRTAYHPCCGDPAMCPACHKSYADSDSCYTFVEDSEDDE